MGDGLVVDGRWFSCRLLPNGKRKPAEAGLNNSLLPSPLFVHYVHSHFEAKTHFSSSWFSPHGVSPNIQNV